VLSALSGTKRNETGRVAVGVTSHRSRRSVRAQLRHTVRPRTGWQCGSHASAEACRTPLPLSREVAVTGHGATRDSAWFPPRGPSAGSALPSTGSSEASSPASQVLRRCATPWVPLAALRFLRLAIPGVVPVISLTAVQGTQPRARSSSTGLPSGK